MSVSGLTPFALNDAPINLSRPSASRYEMLVTKLADVDAAMLNDLSAVRASILAVQAVNEFLGSDPNLRRAGISAALRRLLSDLEDMANGTKSVALLAPEPAENKASGRPTANGFNHHRGNLAAALECLIRCGMTNKQAAQHIAKQLKDANVRYKGSPIEPKQLLQWREQIGDTSPAQADEMYKKIVAGSWRAQSNIDAAKMLTTAVVTTAARWLSKKP